MLHAKTKHVFPGGNTSQGFFSYYDYILSQEKAVRIFIIKGGPGVGKSTFLKKAGNQFVAYGYEVEFLHCSSDSDSLDGIMVPELKISIIDGTAPHIVEPKNPGAIDTIINFADFWDEDIIRQNKQKIMIDTAQVRMWFESAYSFLKAASLIYEDSCRIFSLAIDNVKVNRISNQLIEEFFKDKPSSDNTGNDRRLFASAITPAGLKNYIDTVLVSQQIIGINQFDAIGANNILEKIKNAAIEKGYDVESYYCALRPCTLEHLVIPGINVSLTTVNRYHKPNVAFSSIIDLNEYINKDLIQPYVDSLEYNKIEFDKLLNQAINMLSKAKNVHDRLETYYTSSVDFKKLDMFCDVIINKILNR